MVIQENWGKGFLHHYLKYLERDNVQCIRAWFNKSTSSSTVKNNEGGWPEVTQGSLQWQICDGEVGKTEESGAERALGRKAKLETMIMVTGERTEVYMLSLTNRVGRMVYNSLKLKQTQTKPQTCGQASGLPWLWAMMESRNKDWTFSKDHLGPQHHLRSCRCW